MRNVKKQKKRGTKERKNFHNKRTERDRIKQKKKKKRDKEKISPVAASSFNNSRVINCN